MKEWRDGMGGLKETKSEREREIDWNFSNHTHPFNSKIYFL
jgi:hypothetical protein